VLIVPRADGGERGTYSSARGLLVARLAGNLEGNIVGGVALDLEGGSRQVVEVLVQKLKKGSQSSSPSVGIEEK
jgi:hypothetical protein